MKGPRFFPEALEEYEDAVAHYESCEKGLGDRLIDEFDHAVAVLMEFPGAAPAVRQAQPSHDLRWALLRSFPIKLVYAVRGDEFLIVAVFHARRRPGYWAERLKSLPPRGS